MLCFGYLGYDMEDDCDIIIIGVGIVGIVCVLCCVWVGLFVLLLECVEIFGSKNFFGGWLYIYVFVEFFL